MAGPSPSVKDLLVLESPEAERPGRGVFRFSDRYSVFDWGEMPDHIEDKGRSLCVVGAYFFEKMKEAGIRTHYNGVRVGGKCVNLNSATSPPEEMEVTLVRVIPPQLKNGRYDYSAYKDVHRNYLIPLEVIYRNALPHGSSVFRRLEKGVLKPEDLGIDHFPEPGERLPQPYFDLSTKLESTDRYITWKEAAEIAGITDEALEEIKQVLFSVNNLITEEVEKLGLINEDGKIELAYDGEGRLMVVDVVGTMDECRFSYRGFAVSKEILRIYYRKTPWYQKVEEAKKKDPVNWKNFVDEEPPHLPPEVKKAIEDTYRAFANDLTGRSWFENVPSFAEAVEHLRQVMKEA